MTRPLLAATDFSPAGERAAERAALLAAEHDWPLVLQHVLNSGPLEHLRQLLSHPSERLHARVQQTLAEELERLAAALAERHGASIARHLSEGHVCEQILRHADALDPPLIVVGAQGERPLRHGLLGSTAERLLQTSPRPLLVVKQAPRERYRRVLVPVDFSARSAPAIEQARHLAPSAEWVLLHAYEIPFEHKLRHSGIPEPELTALLLDLQQSTGRQLEQLIARHGLPTARVERSLLHGEAGRRIVEQQLAQHCDLIVLGRRGLGRLPRWLLGSVGNHVLAHAACDVLLLSESPD